MIPTFQVAAMEAFSPNVYQQLKRFLHSGVSLKTSSKSLDAVTTYILVSQLTVPAQNVQHIYLFVGIAN